MKNKYKIILTTIASLSMLICGSSLTSHAKDMNKTNGSQQNLTINNNLAIDDTAPTNKEQNHKNKLVVLKPLSNKDIYSPKDTSDYNKNDIGNMNHFIKIRAIYRYKQIGGNTRDLGGYPTKNNKYEIKPDRIIRSANLQGISKEGIKDLQKLNINKIIDLRYKLGKRGIQGHPDPDEMHNDTLKGTNIKYQNIPVYSKIEAKKIGQYMNHNNVHGEYYYYGDPYVSNPNAIKAYRKIFDDLLNNKHGAILIHCTLGRDRTGVTSALILSALGVNKNIIYHDYLLTDHYHYKYDGMNTQPYPKQAGELNHFFNTINNKYGSMHHYLHKKIDLSNDDIHQLRLMYLQPIKKCQAIIKLRQSKHHKFNKMNINHHKISIKIHVLKI